MTFFSCFAVKLQCFNISASEDSYVHGTASLFQNTTSHNMATYSHTQPGNWRLFSVIKSGRISFTENQSQSTRASNNELSSIELLHICSRQCFSACYKTSHEWLSCSYKAGCQIWQQGLYYLSCPMPIYVQKSFAVQASWNEEAEFCTYFYLASNTIFRSTIWCRLLISSWGFNSAWRRKFFFSFYCRKSRWCSMMLSGIQFHCCF